MIIFTKKYYASLMIGTKDTNAVIYTAVDEGVAGNSIRVWHHNPGSPSHALVVNVSGSDIEVILETNSGSSPISTPAQIVAAIAGTPAAAALVGAAASGSATAASSTAYAYLAGGAATATFTTNSPVVGNRLRHDMRQGIARTEGGHIYVYDKSSGPTYQLSFKFELLTTDEAIDLREFFKDVSLGAMETFELEDWDSNTYEARFLTTELDFIEEVENHFSIEFVLEVDGLPSLTT